MVGRLILMHLEDPVGVLRRLEAAARPGGTLVMADFVMSACRQQPVSGMSGRTADVSSPS